MRAHRLARARTRAPPTTPSAPSPADASPWPARRASAPPPSRGRGMTGRVPDVVLIVRSPTANRGDDLRRGGRASRDLDAHRGDLTD